jgi:hypothetical protein
LDSGASTHVTPDINNLNYYQPYTRSNTVHIGNETGWLIFNTGSTTIPTNSTVLHLTNVLHVPQITKNPLSVSQLTKDNKVLVEFSHNACFYQ